MIRIAPNSNCLRPAIWIVVLVVGCAKQDASPTSATRVILPGEQQLTAPVAPTAVREATAAASAAAGSAAAGSAAAAPAAGTAEPAVAAVTPAAPVESAAAAVTESTGTEFAAFKGRVTVAGSVAAVAPLKAAGDPGVQDKVCVVTAIPDESVVVSADGGLANVFVFAKKLPAGVKAPPPPAEPVVIDQIGCRFVPQAMVLRVGQPLLMKNTDPVAHNVRTSALAMPINQIISPSNTVGIPVTYSRPEKMPVQTRCDIHAWMVGWHIPLDHPYAAVTGPDGAFEIKDLPAGDWSSWSGTGKRGTWSGRTNSRPRPVRPSRRTSACRPPTQPVKTCSAGRESAAPGDG